MSLDCNKKNPGMQIGRIVLPVLTICWMLVIFWFSAAPAPESSEMSYTVGIAVGKIMISDFDAWSTERQNAFAEKIEYPVRKTAHAMEYALLGMLISGTICVYSGNGRKMALYAWVAATIYASSDEFHQLFVPGRSGQVRDVLLDSAGAATGILVLYLLRRIWQKKR